MERTILHMDLDTFFVSVERLYHPELNGKPVLVGGSGDRGVVSAASYEARPFGISSGMSMKLARQLCPEAIVIRGNAGTYTNHSKIVTQIIQENVPVVEKASIDEFYADMTGMDQFFGCYNYAKELRQKIIKETGLPISFGLSTNKTVSKVATSEIKPNNLLKIESGKEKLFLAPLAVNKIPMVGSKTYQALRNLGIKEIRTIQQMPIEMMQAAFGRNGLLIWNKANGIDNSPIIEYHERKSISNERTFGRDTADMNKLISTIEAMAETLAYQLRVGGKLASCIAIKIRYSDFNTYTKQVKIAYTSADHVLIPKAKELFNQLYNRRLLIRLIGVRLSGLTAGQQQINLFDDSQRKSQLYNALDLIRKKYGSRIITQATTMDVRTMEASHNPFNGEPPIVLAHRTA